MPVLRPIAIACLFSAVAACSSDPSSSPDGAPPAPADASFPPARSDVVAALGSDATLDLATWNLENFPRFSTTPESVADLVASLRLDVIVFQEIQNVAALNQITARLPGYAATVSGHTYGDGTYQKLAVVYRNDVVTVDEPALLFQNNGYEFPRPPFKVHVTVTATGLDFDLIALHLKAGFTNEDEDRRLAALTMLESNVRTSVDGSGDDDVFIIGDFNDTIDGGAAILAPFLADTERYRFETAPLADDDRYSFVPSTSLIDHVVSSAALADDLAGSSIEIPDLANDYDGYLTTVSDHLPVVLSVPTP